MLASESLRYGCDLELLPERLRSRFIKLEADADLARYIDLAERRRLSRAGRLLRNLLTLYLSDFDANALVNAYPMHLASAKQWEQLLGGRLGGRLLDVGAGSGDVTSTLAPLFEEVHTTETAGVARWRLRRRGFTVHATDMANGAPSQAPYDAVALLNVVDRCRHPSALLASSVGALTRGGHLILALPLPYSPIAYDGPYLVEPDAPLLCSGQTWEEGVVSLVEQTLEPAGLLVQSLTRAPYLGGFSDRSELAVHDDVIVICRTSSC